MPLSQDPDARRRQLANLKPQSAVTHGAHSGELIRQATGEHLASLVAQFPSATRAELTIQAARMAQIERLAAYVERKGMIRNERKGDVFSAVETLGRLSATFERRLDVLRAREALAGGGGGAESLATILAEIVAEPEEA